MADWRTVTDAEVDPDAPVTSDLMYALRDNPVAIAEGALGAPRIEDPALGGVVTNAGRTWVANRSVGVANGSLSQYVLARYTSVTSPATRTFGQTVNGNELAVAAANGEVDANVTLSGVWSCRGFAISGDQANVTLWQRVS